VAKKLLSVVSIVCNIVQYVILINIYIYSRMSLHKMLGMVTPTLLEMLSM